MSRPPVQYGELLDQARRSANRAQTSLARDAFMSPEAARAALAARGRLLVEIGEHATTVLGPARVQAWRDGDPPRRGVEHRGALVRQVLEWIDLVDEAGLRCPSIADHNETGSEGSRASQCLDIARAHVAAAGELVASHHDLGGALVEPAPRPLLDTGMGAQLSSALRLALALAPNEPLALRCRQAGLAREEVDQALPLGAELETATWDLARTLRFPATGLDGLAVAGSDLDCSEPGVEWQQRMARIDRRLYRHELAGRVNVQTLRDVAYLGLVTSHVLTTSGIRTTPEVGAATEQFKQLVDYLAPLRSTQPGDQVVARDVQRMLDLAHPAATADDPIARSRLLRAIDASVPVLDACGERGSRLLAHTSDAWIPARPRATYLKDPFPSGTAAQRAPAPPVDWPLLQPPQPGLGLA